MSRRSNMYYQEMLPLSDDTRKATRSAEKGV